MTCDGDGDGDGDVDGGFLIPCALSISDLWWWWWWWWSMTMPHVFFSWTIFFSGHVFAIRLRLFCHMTHDATCLWSSLTCFWNHSIYKNGYTNNEYQVKRWKSLNHINGGYRCFYNTWWNSKCQCRLFLDSHTFINLRDQYWFVEISDICRGFLIKDYIFIDFL